VPIITESLSISVLSSNFSISINLYRGTKHWTSCPSFCRASERDPTTSPSPPVFAKGNHFRCDVKYSHENPLLLTGKRVQNDSKIPVLFTSKKRTLERPYPREKEELGP